MELRDGIVAILNDEGKIAGTGFMVTESAICTCAHNVRYRQKVSIRLHDGNQVDTILDDKYFSEEKDIAILRFNKVPNSIVTVLPIGASSGTDGRKFYSYGYAIASDILGIGARGEIIDKVGNKGQELLQLSSPQITSGFSGAPVLDEERAIVVGMVSRGSTDNTGRNAQTSFAIPSETLREFFPEIRLIPTKNQSANKADVEGQEQRYRQAIEKNPKDTTTYLKLGDLLEKQKKIIETEEVFRNAIKAIPNDSRLYRELGRALELQNKFEEAMGFYEQSVQINPKDGRSYHSMGILQEKIGNLEKALSYFLRAIEILPNEAGIYRNLGRLYERQNHIDEAVAAYRKANELRPDSGWTNRRLEELSKRQKAGDNKPSTPDSSSVKSDSVVQSEPVISEAPTTENISSEQLVESGNGNEPPVSPITTEQIGEPEPLPTPESSDVIKPYTVTEDALDKHAATDKPIQSIKQDKLDFKIYVNALHSFILSKYTTTPITISIDGPWGTGKSSLMSMLKGKLDPQRDGVRKLYEWFAALRPWWSWYFGFLKSSIAKWFGKTVISLFVRNDVDDSDIHLYFGETSPRFKKFVSNIVEGFSIDPEIINQTGNESMDKNLQWWAQVHADCEPMQPYYHYAVWLNAWKFDNQEEVWASLALATMEQIKQKHGLLWRLRFWLELTFSRFSFWSGLWQVVKQFLLPLLFAIVAAYYDVIMGSFDLQLDAFKQYGSPLLWAGAIISGLLAVSSIFKDPFQIPLDKVFDRPNYKDKVKFLSHFEKDFAKIVRSATKNGLGWKPSKLVIFIDDLDRCEPPKSADIVEAVNLFLDAEGCIFVIGMDSDSVSKSVEVKYKDLFERMKAENTGVVSLGRSFLDKIVQIPFSVPRATPGQITRMVEDAIGQQFSTLGALPVPAPIDQKDEITQRALDDKPPAIPPPTPVEPILNIVTPRIDPASYAKPEVRAAILKGTELLADNPRQVKTFINLFRLSIYIANERKILEEKIVAEQTSGLNLEKLAMWTACSVRWPSLVKHFHEDTQITPLRIFMHSISQKIQPTFIWSEPSITPDEVKKIYRELRDYEKGSDSHWCYLPWEWWLLEPDFLKAIKSLQDLWNPTEVGETDWLRVLLTMTRPIV